MDLHITDTLNFCRQFVGRKIKKVSFQTTSTNDVIADDHFNAWNAKTDGYVASGSWDDGSNNEVSVHRIEMISKDNDEERRLVKCAGFLTCADVMDLEYITSDKMIYCSSEGDLTILQYNQASNQLKRINRWSKLHDGCCSAFSMFGDEIVTVGEDGRLNFVNLSKAIEVKNLKSANDKKQYSPFYCINRRRSKNEAIVGDSLGQIMVFDLRSYDDEDFSPLVLPRLNRMGASTTLESHPAQPHLLVSGYQSGDVAFWDLRSPNIPVSVFSSVHRGPIWWAKFHPYYCNNFFTCGDDGRLVHWDLSGVQKFADRLDDKDVWMINDITQKKMKWENLLPESQLSVNCADLAGNSLVCCTDNETICLFSDLKFN